MNKCDILSIMNIVHAHVTYFGWVSKHNIKEK